VTTCRAPRHPLLLGAKAQLCSGLSSAAAVRPCACLGAAAAARLGGGHGFAATRGPAAGSALRGSGGDTALRQSRRSCGGLYRSCGVAVNSGIAVGATAHGMHWVRAAVCRRRRSSVANGGYLEHMPWLPPCGGAPAALCWWGWRRHPSLYTVLTMQVIIIQLSLGQRGWCNWCRVLVEGGVEHLRF